LAEIKGKTRGTRKDYRHFVINAFGSGAELETQLEIAKRLGFNRNFDFTNVATLLEEIMKMLNALAGTLSDAT